jgi:uncharacterized protein YndB with AHSA1/START domain
MGDKFTAEARIAIKASAAKVWEALTDPKLVSQYLFGTQVETDWKVGSPIRYTGSWEGKSYEDKGTILEVVPLKLLKSTYWSSMGGTPDLPENYNTVTYELFVEDGETTLAITQDNNSSRESAEHSAANWKTVLAAIKELLEK